MEQDPRPRQLVHQAGGVVPDATWPATRARAAEVAALAGAHRIGLVTFHAGFIPHEPGPERDRLFGRLREIAATGERKLIETLAEDLAAAVTAFDGVGAVTLEVEKFILPDCDRVSVEITRARER